MPGTPPQLPARPARTVDASEDGGAGADCQGANSAAPALPAANAANASGSGGGEAAIQHKVAAAPPVRAQCMTAQPAAAAEVPAAAAAVALPPPADAASPFDRALAAHLAGTSSSHPGANGAGSSGSSAQTAGSSADGRNAGSSVAVRLPCEPVVRSFRQEVSPSTALPQPPQQPASGAATEAATTSGPIAEQVVCDARKSTGLANRLPAERLHALAAQQLSPPPWAQPAALTPTGHTAQVTIAQYCSEIGHDHRIQQTPAGCSGCV